MTAERDRDTLNRPEPEAQRRESPGAGPRNQELAKQAARDALRVVHGELSEEEFYDKYHEAYLQEFGLDRRAPGTGQAGRDQGKEESASLSGAGRGTSRLPARPKTNGPLSRRAFLMLAGGGGAAFAIAAFLGGVVPKVVSGSSRENPESSGQPRNGKKVQIGMVIDLERCTGCMACVDGCHRENNLEPGVHWMYVMAYADEGEEGTNFLVRPCNHCSNPPCVKVCPTMARHKREKDGLVLTDYDICIGTRYCQVACPYGVNYFQWGQPTTPESGWRYSHRKDYRGRTVEGNPPRGVMGKCTMCPQRQDSESKRNTTACQQACPHDVIFVGDMNDPDSVPRRYLEKKRQEKGGKLSTFRLLDHLGTEPNILYIGHQPSEKSLPVDGPITYEDWGWVEERGTVLDGPRPWIMRVFGG